MRRHQLAFNADGGAELLCNGKTVWASDNDPDFNEEFSDDVFAEAPDDDELAEDDDDEEFEEELINDVLAYLVEKRYLTRYQADKCVVAMPKELDEEETTE
jgi:hypothetical protein